MTEVDELERLMVRLRERQIVQQGEPVSFHMADGSVVAGSTGDVTCARNPDGPEAATAIEYLLTTLKARDAEIEGLRAAVIEECAKVCEDHPLRSYAHHYATAIRALRSPTTKGGE